MGWAREIQHREEGRHQRDSDLWPDCAAFLIILVWVATAKVVLVEVESISITTFLSYCPLVEKTLANLNAFSTDQIRRKLAGERDEFSDHVVWPFWGRSSPLDGERAGPSSWGAASWRGRHRSTTWEERG